MWLIKILLVCVFFLSYANSAAASQAECYTNSLVDIQREITKVEDSLPVSKLSSVKNIALRYSPDPEFRFPYSLNQDGMRYLVLTRGYINLACDLAAGTIYGPHGSALEYLGELSDCINSADSDISFSQCRKKLLPSERFTVPETASHFENFLLHIVFLGVVQAAVEHELSHFTNNDFSISASDIEALQLAEVRADIASLLGVTSAGSLSIGVGEIFLFVDKIDALSPSHLIYQTTSCRSRFFAFAAPALVGKLMRINLFVRLGIDIGPDYVELIETSNTFHNPLQLRQSMSGCDQQYSETLGQLIADVDLVYDFLDRDLSWKKPGNDSDALKVFVQIDALLDDVELVDSLVFRVFLLLNANYGQISSDYSEEYYDILYSLLSDNETVNRIVVTQALAQIGQAILLRDLDADKVKAILRASQPIIAQSFTGFLQNNELLISPILSKHRVAEAALRSSIEFNPDNSVAHFHLARVAAGNGRCQRASKYMRLASEKVRDRQTKMNLAWVADNLHVPDESEECRRVSALIFLYQQRTPN